MTHLTTLSFAQMMLMACICLEDWRETWYTWQWSQSVWSNSLDCNTQSSVQQKCNYLVESWKFFVALKTVMWREHKTLLVCKLYSKFLNDCYESLHLFCHVLSTVLSPFINLTALEERICGKELSAIYNKIHVLVIAVMYLYVGFKVCSRFLS